MRHYRVVSILCLCGLTLACQRPDPIRLQKTLEEPAVVMSKIRISDPSTSSQLVRGFYPLEANTWRWAGPHFTVELGVPPKAREYGATLVVKLHLPDISIQKLKKITLNARVGALALSPQAYSTAGELEYRRSVPAAAFTENTVEADFTLDKFLNMEGDPRQLGVVVTDVGLEPK